MKAVGILWTRPLGPVTFS